MEISVAELQELLGRKNAVRRAKPRFINLDANGQPTDGDHVAVYQTATDLIWAAASLHDGKEFSQPDALQAAADLDLLGARIWRLPTIQELLSIIDYERCDPAVDPKHFKGPHGWVWSSTVAKAPAGCAWGVDLYVGFSDRFRQGNHDLALAVRAGQGVTL